MFVHVVLKVDEMSPSTRRAWIEIMPQSFVEQVSARVALHPEGVDRNVYKAMVKRKRHIGRPPPGGRG